MKKFARLFISYCEQDKGLKDQLKQDLNAFKDAYEKEGVEIELCEMETHCSGEWDSWMIGAVKSSDVLVCLLTENVINAIGGGKRVKEELKIARDEGKGIVPIVLTKLTDEYLAHIGCISQEWYGRGKTHEEIFANATYKVKLLTDAVLKGDVIKQYESNKIIGKKFIARKAFVGRKEEIARLREILLEENVVVIKGEGGIGKTSLAQQFFEENQDLYEEAYVIDASEGIRKTLTNFPFEGTEFIKDEQKRYKENLKRIGALSSKTIIILDNYDYEVEGDEEALAQIKELYCRCLVTSRVELENFTTLNIGRMTDGELIELVERKCPRIYEMNKGTKERTQVLLKEFFANVEGLTIAVELASVIMSNGDYLLSEINKAILECSDSIKMGREKDKAFNHLAKIYNYASVSKEEKEVLNAVCHVCPSVGIKRRELRDLLGHENNDVINELIEKTFLRTSEDKRVSMHALLSDVYYKEERVWEKDNKAIIERLLHNKIEVFDEGYVHTNTGNLLRYKYLLEKRERSLSNLENGAEIRAGLINDIGAEFFKRGEEEIALNYFVLAMNGFMELEDKEDQAIVYNNIGAVYGASGANNASIPYFLKAVEYLEADKEVELSQTDVAKIYNNLGATLGRLGKRDEALKNKEKALQSLESIASKNKQQMLELASCYCNIGITYCDLFHYEKALDYQEKALAIRKDIFNEDLAHPDVASSYDNLGIVYGEMGEYRKSLEHHLLALGIREEVYASTPNHPAMGKIFNNVGVAYGDLGEHKKALEYKLKALEIIKVAFGKVHAENPAIARIYNNVGATYGDLGDHQKALEYKLQALKIFNALFGENSTNPAFIICLINLAESYEALNEEGEARKHYERALNISLAMPEREQNKKLVSLLESKLASR